MASIKPIKNKAGKIISYQIIVYDGMRNGKKFRKTKTVNINDLSIPKYSRKKEERILEEVTKIASKFEQVIKHGNDFSDGSKVTFNDLLDRWNKEVLAVKVCNGDITEGCRERYVRMIELYALGLDSKKARKHEYYSRELDGILLKRIKPVNIDETIKRMTEAKLSKKTIRNFYNALRQCFQYAVRNRWMDSNPCNDVSVLPQVKRNHDLHTFSEEQAQRFLNEALKVDIPRSHAWKKQMDQLYFTMLLCGGFRKSELLALTWNDINPDTYTVTINKAVGYDVKEKEFIKDPKTESGNRRIILPSICFRMLTEWKNQCKEICLKAGKEWQGYRRSFDNNYIFIRSDGRRMSIKEPLKHFHMILEEYNNSVPDDKKLPIIRLHDLRHTCASHLVAAGTDIETVARRLGHSNPSFTLDVYAHALDEKDKEASDTLEQLFSVTP